MHKPKTINTYDLENPLIWATHEELIYKALLNCININFSLGRDKVKFAINPTCGWIYFERKDQMWSEIPKITLVQSASLAEEIATGFLQKLNKETSGEAFQKNKIPPVIPVSSNVRIEHSSTKMVPHHTLEFIDHWVVVFTVYLNTHYHTREFTEVTDSTITVRIGNHNQIIGFSSQWRPTFLHVKEYDTVIPQAESHDGEHSHDTGHSNDNHHGEHGDGEHEYEDRNDTPNDEVKVIYALGGENMFSNAILPYHVGIVGGHHFTYSPACVISFTIQLDEYLDMNDDNEINIVINGGSGNFVYSVHAWEPENIFEKGTYKITDDDYDPGYSKIYLPKGVFNLIVWVADTSTGVIKKTEKSIYSMPILKDEIQIQSV